MKVHLSQPGRKRGGFTLTEMMVAFGIGILILLGFIGLFVAGLSNFTGLGNYAQLSNQSRLAMDNMSRDIRECTQLIGYQTNANLQTLTFSNAYNGTQVSYTWNSTNSTLTCDKTGQPTQTYLTGCDSWSFSLFQRTPETNWTFYPTTNLSTCKLINMTWKCSRTILSTKVNTENIVTAEVVLRNKH